MQQWLFLLMVTVPLVMLLALDRKNIRTYVLLGLFGVACGVMFENLTTWLGFWTHITTPRLGLVSVWTAMGYFHYLCFSWFLGNLVKRRLGR